MDEQERIKQLEEEIQQLSFDLNSYHQRLQQLRREVLLLKGVDVTAQTSPATAQRQPFSLENFIGLKLLHLIGIVVLVIGLSIGVKYAIDEQLISEFARILLAYLAGGLLFFFSLRLKKNYVGFSAILFSGAMASLYFTTYAAFVYYNMFPFWMAFVAMMLLTGYTTYGAINYDRQEIGVLGMVGAYSIPFLISQNNENAILFFSYILVINIGIIVISFKKMWKVMSQVAMFITWILFIAWLSQKYQQGQFAAGMMFMLAFYLLFTVGAVAYHFSRQEKLTVFDIQMILANNMALYLGSLFIVGDGTINEALTNITGIFCLLACVMALLSAYLLPAEKMLKRVLLIQAICYLILYVAMQWDGIIVTLLWLLLSISLFAWGVYSKQSWLRMASIIIVSITLLKLITIDSMNFSTVEKIICYVTIGALLLIVSFFYQKFKEKLFGD
jgi:uncharacterized membrane protein